MMLATVAQAQPRWAARPCARASSRSTRGLPCAVSGAVDAGPPVPQYAFFEWAPLDGGTGGNSGPSNYCTCAAPTTPDGGALTITRASGVTCSKPGTYENSVFADGDLVRCANNQLAFGAHGGLVEGAASNDCLYSEDPCDPSWTDTAICSSAVVTPPMVSPISAAATLEDTSGIVAEGASQLIATTSANKHAWGCYVQAGTAIEATVSMVGVGSSAGDCSVSASVPASGWARLQCGSTTAYGALLTAVTVSILVGSAASDTGSIAVWGCQHESGAAHGGPGVGQLSSYIPTEGTPVARSAVTRFSFGLPGNPGSMAISRWGQDNRNQGTTAYLGWQSGLTSGFEFLAFAVDADTSLRCYTSALGGAQAPANGAKSGRTWCAVSGSVGLSGQLDGVAVTPSTTATPGASQFLIVGPYNGVTQPWGEFGAICADSSATRCR